MLACGECGVGPGAKAKGKTARLAANGSAPQRSDARGNTTDIEYIYMRNRSDRGLELINDDSWWWLKRNSERVFNDAKTAQDRNTEVTLMWNLWRSTLFSLYPNVIAIGDPGETFGCRFRGRRPDPSVRAEIFELAERSEAHTHLQELWLLPLNEAGSRGVPSLPHLSSYPQPPV